MKNIGKTGTGRFDLGGADPPALHRRASLGAPRHRRTRVVPRRRAGTPPRARRPSARGRSSSSSSAVADDGRGLRLDALALATRPLRHGLATATTTARRCRRRGRSARVAKSSSSLDVRPAQHACVVAEVAPERRLPAALFEQQEQRHRRHRGVGVPVGDRPGVARRRVPRSALSASA